MGRTTIRSLYYTDYLVNVLDGSIFSGYETTTICKIVHMK